MNSILILGTGHQPKKNLCEVGAYRPQGATKVTAYEKYQA
jgi:hypothetical protein